MFRAGERPDDPDSTSDRIHRYTDIKNLDIQQFTGLRLLRVSSFVSLVLAPPANCLRVCDFL